MYVKKNFPTSKIRRFLEPGPVVLVSSASKGERNIMTMGWYMMMGFSPTPPIRTAPRGAGAARGPAPPGL